MGIISFWEDFRWARKIKLLNKIQGLGCIILIILSLNILSMHYFYRFDFQKKQNFVLEECSLNILASLKDSVEIFLFYGYTQNSDIPFFVNDLRNLLKEYKHAASGKIKIRFIDIIQQPRMADELSLKFGTVAANHIVISSQEHFRIIPAFELYEFKDRIVSGFKGERIISDEILKVSNRDMKKVLFSTGHGEIDCESVHSIYGSSSARDLLKQSGYLVEKINLRGPIVQKNAKLLIIAGAQTKFTANEIQNLKTFLKQDGRILILLSPPKLCGFEDLFFDWGILADDMLIINMNNKSLGLSGDNIVDNFTEHKITKPMLDLQLRALFGLCQPVRTDIGSPATKQCRVTPLFFSSEKTFAKLDYLQGKLKYNPSEDLIGPISIAALSEEVIDKNTASHTGKLLVIGSANFINNNCFYVLGNKILFNAMTTWLLDDVDSSTNFIKTKAIEFYKIILSKSELMQIGKLLLLIPTMLLLWGWFIAFIRRNF